MDAGLAAVIGAAVGAVGGVSGGVYSSWTQGRQQAHQHAAERRSRREEGRRQAYEGFLTASKRLSACAWKMSDRLWEEGSTAEQWQLAFSDMHSAWEAFSASEAAVSIVGPASVAQAAQSMRQALRQMEMAATRWYRRAVEQHEGRIEDSSQEFHRAAEAKRAFDRMFLTAARRALDAEDP